MNPRVSQAEKAVEHAERALKRVQRDASLAGCLMLAAAAGEARDLLADAVHEELSFRAERGLS